MKKNQLMLYAMLIGVMPLAEAAGQMVESTVGKQVTVQSQDKHAKDPVVDQSVWHGERSLGFNRATGNSSNESMLAKVRLTRVQQNWNLDMSVETIVSSAGENKTRQSVTADVQADIDFNQRNYSFANLRYNTDRYGSIDSQASLSAGIGWRVFGSEVRVLSLESGVGLRRSQQRIIEDDQSELVLRGKLDWQYQLTDSTRLLKKLRVESGPGNTLLESEAAVRLKVTADMGLKFSYRLKSNSNVPEGAEGVDTLTAISLDYLF